MELSTKIKHNILLVYDIFLHFTFTQLLEKDILTIILYESM